MLYTNKKPIQTSYVWKYFTQRNHETMTAICKLCLDNYSYRNSITNLKRHLMRKHKLEMTHMESQKDVEKDEKERDTEKNITTTPVEPLRKKYRSNKSVAWKFFDKNESRMWAAKCRICSSIISYKTGVSNLVKHVQRKHFSESAHILKGARSELDEDDTEQETSNVTHNVLSTHEMEMSIMDSGEDVDMAGKKEETEENLTTTTTDTESARKKIRRRKSIAWKFFDKDECKMWAAKCRLCGCLLSYKAGVSNLVKHVQRKHLPETVHILNGTGSDHDGEDNEDELSFISKLKKQEMDNTNMDSEDDVEMEGDKKEILNLVSNCAVGSRFKCLSAKLRISMCLFCNERFSSLNIDYLKKHLMKHHPNIKLTDEDDDAKNILLTADGQIYEVESNDAEQNNENNETDEEKDNLDVDTVYFEDSVESSPEPPASRAKIRKRRRPEPENIHKYNRTSDSLVKAPRPVQKSCETCNKDDSLQHFGTYILSLMRKLPRHVSNQLQTSFVKLIMDAQLTSETQPTVITGQNSSYSITVAQCAPGTGAVIDLPVINLNTDEEG